VRFLEVSEQAGRYVARVSETETPVAGPGEVLIRVATSGVNRADLSQIAGRYPPPPGESTILGLEVSGTVQTSGEQVCALLAGGGHAEYVAAPVGQVFPAPPRIDLASAAGIPEAFLTAFVNLGLEAGLSAGKTALIHAGASGVGLAAIQLARFLGARVVATTRTKEKLPALERAGADLAVCSSSEDVVTAIESRWGSGAVDVVLDPIGAASLAADLAVLAVGGSVVLIATMSGARAELDISALMKRRGRIVGSTLRSRSRPEKAAIVARFREAVLPGFASGQLSVTVDSVFPLERAADAFQRMRENRNIGKMLLDWRSGITGRARDA
jgi:putative PIG3 family NAD(P)H quinone oxidoreductase